MTRKFNSIEDELHFVEFRQELLFNNTALDECKSNTTLNILC